MKIGFFTFALIVSTNCLGINKSNSNSFSNVTNLGFMTGGDMSSISNDSNIVDDSHSAHHKNSHAGHHAIDMSSLGQQAPVSSSNNASQSTTKVTQHINTINTTSNKPTSMNFSGLGSSNQGLYDWLARLRAGEATLKVREETLLARRDSLNAKMTELNADTKKINADRAALNGDIESHNAKQSTLDDLIAKLNNNRLALNSAIEQFNADRATLDAKWDALRSAQAKLESEQTAFNADRDLVNKASKKLNKDIASMKAGRELLDKMSKKLNDSNALHASITKISSDRGIFNAATSKYNSDLTEYNNNNVNLSSRMNQLKQNMATLNQKQIDFNAIKLSVNSDFDARVSSWNISVTSNQSSLTTQENDFNDRLAAAQAKFNAINNKRATYIAELNALRTMNNNLNARFADLQGNKSNGVNSIIKESNMNHENEMDNMIIGNGFVDDIFQN